jgi:hypothetical protein
MLTSNDKYMKIFEMSFCIALLASASCTEDKKQTSETNSRPLIDSIKPSQVIELTEFQKDSIRSESVKGVVGRYLHERGFEATDHTLSDDARMANGGVYLYNSPPYEESLVIRFNKNKTAEFVFHPIGGLETVTKKVHWKVENGLIQLESDIMVKVPVKNADFPLSEDPFYEYILIKREVRVDGTYAIIDERETSRSNFFVQLEIARQRGEANSDIDYARKLLEELSFGTDMVTRYLYHFG